MIRAIQFQNKRVGSTFLQQAINSHTDIVGIDEVFVNMAKRKSIRKSNFIPFVNSDLESAQEYIEDVLYRTYPDTNMSFKLMYNQVNHHYGLFQYIMNNRIPIIHVVRRNLLKQVISFHKMGEDNHKPLNITAHQLFNDVVQAENENNKWSKSFYDNIKLRLYYEDMIGKTEGEKTYLAPLANAAVCDFFNVKTQMLFATTKKKNKEDISVYLPNIDKIKKKFKGSKYEWMVDE